MTTPNQETSQKPDITTDKENWLLHFPIMFFAAIMGLGGLALVVSKTLKTFELETNLLWFSNVLSILSVILFCGITLLYLAKILLYYPAFLKELKHPVRINFFAAISVSLLIILMLLLRLTWIPLWFAFALFYIGAFLQLIFSLYVVRFWFINEMQQKMANPAWFIPIVGNLIVPLAGANLNLQNESGWIPFEILIFYFGMGSFFWILLNATLLIRLVFGENLPQKFLPTLFIFIAPPSIFALDILVLFEKFTDISTLYGIASASFSVALFFMFLMISLLKVFRQLKFALSWWAFTFPTTAFTLCALELYALGGSLFYAFFGILGIVLSSILVCIVALRTLLAIKQRQICVLEE
ncbi:SLAC1 anion channel family protein [uncultured Helicobacter sp.]|uniref:SLAC1 anion channel family protein n=1 Tax=uncultured Helicobacter sp. TaxID=175537 RepID=UPI002611CDBB|nr:SLAC1 anion channel family protein [uncultured Helicobacter sp.]